MTAPLPLFPPSWPTPAPAPSLGPVEAVASMGAAADERARPAVVEPPQGLSYGVRVRARGQTWTVRYVVGEVVEVVGPDGFATLKVGEVVRV